jgi:hypothetical protein
MKKLFIQGLMKRTNTEGIHDCFILLKQDSDEMTFLRVVIFTIAIAKIQALKGG